MTQQTFTKIDMEFRETSVQNYESYITNFFDDFSSEVQPKTAEEASKAMALSLSTVERQEKTQLLHCLNMAISELTNYFALLQITTEHAKKNIGACQEFVTASIGILMELYGLGYVKELSLESVTVYMPDGRNHNLLVINRAPASNLRKVEEWGGDCLIFDPQQKFIYCPTNLPGLALAMSKVYTENDGYKISIQGSNDFGISALNKWAKHPKFGTITALYQKSIDQYCREKLHQMMTLWLNEKLLVLNSQEGTEPCAHKPFLIDCLEKKSALSFIGVKTKDWRTHHFALLPSAAEQEKAVQLQKEFPGHGVITSIKGYGNVLFFANTNNDGNKQLHDAVSRAMEEERAQGLQAR